MSARRTPVRLPWFRCRRKRGKVIPFRKENIHTVFQSIQTARTADSHQSVIDFPVNTGVIFGDPGLLQDGYVVTGNDLHVASSFPKQIVERHLRHIAEMPC